MKRTKANVTIGDVAKAAGVSVSTVSRVLNDKDDVAPETYEKVQRTIEELNYTSSLAAKSMRSRRTIVWSRPS
jgi:LacI family transcriptional regulator